MTFITIINFTKTPNTQKQNHPPLKQPSFQGQLRLLKNEVQFKKTPTAAALKAQIIPSIQKLNTDFKKEIKEKIPFEKFDIIHTHALRPDVYAFFHFPRKSKAHLVCTIHNYVFEDSNDYKGRFWGPIIAIIWQIIRNRNERFLVLSNAHYNYYKKCLLIFY